MPPRRRTRNQIDQDAANHQASSNNANHQPSSKPTRKRIRMNSSETQETKNQESPPQQFHDAISATPQRSPELMQVDEASGASGVPREPGEAESSKSKNTFNQRNRSKEGRALKKSVQEDQAEELRASEEGEPEDPEDSADPEDESDSEEEIDSEEEEEEEEEPSSQEMESSGGNYSDVGDFMGSMLQRLAQRAGLSVMGGMATSGTSATLGPRFKRLQELIRGDDPSEQFMAVQELNEILSVSTEETLGYGSGSGFYPEQILPDLVNLINGVHNALGVDNPELQLLACRCISNLLEALPTHNTYYAILNSGAIPALCQKLMNIEFIDVAEQAITLLEKLSVEQPKQIVKEGGLTAVLQFLDFFGVNIQRSALNCAANLLVNVPKDQLAVCVEAMPMLANLLNNSDQKIVESACLAIGHAIESFQYRPVRTSSVRVDQESSKASLQKMREDAASQLEQLILPSLLASLLPIIVASAGGSAASGGQGSVTVSPSTFVYMVKSIGILARDSPRLAAAIMKLNIGETLAKLISATPITSLSSIQNEENENVDNEMVKTAAPAIITISNRSTDQWNHIMDLIIALLPETEVDKRVQDGRSFLNQMKLVGSHARPAKKVEGSDEPPTNTVAESLLIFPLESTESDGSSHSATLDESLHPLMYNYCSSLLPYIIELYYGTVNSSVRIRCLLSIVRMIAFLNSDDLVSILKNVPFASFIARVVGRCLPTTAFGDHSKFTNSNVASNLNSSENIKVPGNPSTTPIKMDTVTLVSHSTVASPENPAAASVSEPQTADTLVKVSNMSAATLAMLVYSLYLSDLVMKKLPNFYHVYLRRDGVMFEFYRLAKHVHSDDTTPATVRKQLHDILVKLDVVDGFAKETSSESNSDDSIAEKVNKLTNRSELCKQYNRLVDSWFLLELGLRANKFLSTYETLTTSPSDENSLVSLDDDQHPAALILRFFRKLADDLHSVETIDTQKLSTLRKISEFFHPGVSMDQVTSSFVGPSSGITHFELYHSGILDSLLDWVAKTHSNLADTDQSRAFFECFVDNPLVFSILVKRLHECLGRLEPFELAVPFAADADLAASKSNPLILATRQIRIRLQALDNDDEVSDSEDRYSTDASVTDGSDIDVVASRGLSNIVVSVPAIATFKSIHDFLLPKLAMRIGQLEKRDREKTKSKTAINTSAESSAPARRRSSGRRRQPDLKPSQNDASPDETKDKEDVEMTKVSSEDESVPDEPEKADSRVRLDSNTIHDINSESDTAAAQRSTTWASVASPSTGKWTLEFSLADMKVSSDMGVYGAIHRLEQEHKMRTMNGVPADREGVVSSVFANVRGFAQSDANNRLSSPANVFTNIYTIKYRIVPRQRSGSAEFDAAAIQSPNVFQAHVSPLNLPYKDVEKSSIVKHGFNLPSSLSQFDDETFVKVLCMLKHLHSFNQQLPVHQRLPSSRFVNNKLVAKVNRQLSDLLIVAGGLLPSWCTDLCKEFGFLFPMETRLKLMQSISFGVSRLIMRWNQAESSASSRPGSRQNSMNMGSQLEDSHVFGRMSRQKVRIHRDKLFESMMKVIDMYGGNSKYMLEIEFYDEAGSGLGPTLEFYSLVSREWQRKSLNMWRDVQPDVGEHVFCENGLFPLPLHVVESAQRDQVLKCFKILGKFVAKSLLDFRLIDIPFNEEFLTSVIFKRFRPKEWTPVRVQSLAHLKEIHRDLQILQNVDEKLGNGLRHLYDIISRRVSGKFDESLANEVNALCLDFTLPGHPNLLLCEGGDKKPVTLDDLDTYLQLVIDMVIYNGVYRQIKAFRKGFDSILSVSDLKVLKVDELVKILSSGAWEGPWQRDDLLNAIKADHGFNLDSRPIQWLIDFMTGLDQQQQRLFLQFITGSPKLPIGGFKALLPPLTIVCKTCRSSEKPDQYLPSVMTCVNYIKLPDYSSFEVLKERLLVAMLEGQGSFHLS